MKSPLLATAALTLALLLPHGAAQARPAHGPAAQSATHSLQAQAGAEATGKAHKAKKAHKKGKHHAKKAGKKHKAA